MRRSGLGVMAGGMLWATAAPAHAQSSFADATSMTWDGVGTGIFLGLLVFSVVYNAAFFALLRERFLLWQSARTMAYVALTILLSPLALGTVLLPASFERQVAINIFFDLGIVLSGPFLRSYLEPQMIGPRLYRLLGWPPALILLTTPAVLMADASPAYQLVRNILFLAMLVLAVSAVAIAIRRGSRTARYQAIAWSGITLVFAVSLFFDMVLQQPFALLLFALFPALALETILTALGILDRLLRLRSEREDARTRANALNIIAHTDALTGLGNRRALEEAFAARRPTAVAIIDLDHFKAINDQFGHDVGDKVIFAAGTALTSGSAIATRVGGEEFALLLYGSHAEAMRVAESLRHRITGHVAQMVAELEHPVTASMGLALVGTGSSYGAAMKAADINLYAAKNAGRNRSVLPTARAA